MKQWKLLIILATTAVIALATVGVAYGHYTYIQTTANPNRAYSQTSGFFGWLRGCFARFGYQPYNDYPYDPPKTEVPPPNEGYYPYRYGRGCWGW